MSLEKIFPQGRIKTQEELDKLIEIIKSLEDSQKIERIDPIIPIYGYNTFWFKDKETGEIWILIYYNFPLYGIWMKFDRVLLKDALLEIEELLYREIKFTSYDDFYGFIIDFINFISQNYKIREPIKVFYEWDEEEYKESRRVDISSKENFIKSILIPKWGKHYNERILIVGFFEFSYYHNLGYREIVKYDDTRGSYKHEIVDLGFPTEVSFECTIEVDENKCVYFGDIKVSLEKLESLVVKNNGKISKILYKDLER